MRFGSILPHHSEYLLITACLLYPKVKLFPQSTETFPSLTKCIFLAEDLSTEPYFNEHLLESIIEEDIPEEFCEVVNKYVKDYGVTLSELVDVMDGTEEKIKLILFRFLDDRLRDEVDSLCRKLKFVQEVTERSELLKLLNRRKVQQEMVMEELGEL